MKQRGFSLIEACIALVIVGLLAAPIIAQYNDHMRRVENDITAANLFAVKSALEAYYIKNNRYPCPASLNKKMGDTGYGEEATTDADSCIPSALTAGNCWQGVCMYEDTTTTPPPTLLPDNRRIVHGGVPFAVLQMNEDRTYDGYGRRISYVLTAAMGRRAAGVNFPGAGAIKFETIDRTTDQIVPDTGSPAHVLVMSHGPNGLGAYNKEGISTDFMSDINTGLVTALCSRGLTSLDARNCDNRASTPFIVATSRGMNPNSDRYLDDRIMAITAVPSSAWQQAAVEKEIMSSLMVGIGTNNVGVVINANGKVPLDADGIEKEDPYPSRIGLDVNGIIRADNTKTQQICNADGTGCFSSSALAGIGIIDCTKEETGMAGIYNSKGRCQIQLKINNPTAKTCASGSATGIIGGVIQCSP